MKLDGHCPGCGGVARGTNPVNFERLVFSDQNDNIYKDDDYKNALREVYLRDIREDLEWYGEVYSIIENKYDINDEAPDAVVDGLMKRFCL